MIRRLALLAAICGAFACTASAHAQYRSVLATDTTAYVSPSGSDVNLPCTLSSAPCLTIQAPLNYYQRGFDLAGHALTISLAHGTYASGVLLNGPFVGQLSPFSVQIIGDPANQDAVVIQPTTGYCVGMAFFAELNVSGLHCDQSHNTDNAGGGFPGNDQFEVTQGSQLWFDHITFGDGTNPYNDVTVAGPGSVAVENGPYYVEKSYVALTATYGSNASALSVSSCAGIVPGMLPVGPDFPPNAINPGRTQITGCAGGVMTLNNFTTAAATGVSIGATHGGNAHIATAIGATYFANTNCGQNPNAVLFFNQPAYYQAFAYAIDASTMNFGDTFTNGSNVHGYQFDVEMNAAIRTCGTLPGTVAGSLSRGGQAW